MLELWPFTNFHDMNLDWIIKTIKTYTKKVDDLYNFGLYDFVERVLTAHPEWTTTVMDGAITPAKFAQDTIDLINRTARSAVNVLSLGVDNTGVTDCSTILNDYDENLPLYFPAGTYKVDSTVNIKTSWYGAGCVRGAYGTHEYTKIVIGNNAKITGYDTAGSIIVQDVDFYQESLGDAIHLQSNGSTVYYTLNNVSLHNHKDGAGIKCEGVYNYSSRAFHLDNVFVFGAGINYHGRGIFFTGLSGDNYLGRIEVMGCTTGVELSSYIFRGDNWHIWCGVGPNQIHTQADEDATRCVVTNNATSLSLNTLYTDTVYIAIVANTNTDIAIGRLIHRDDGTLTNSTANGEMVYFAGTPRTAIVTIDEADIQVPTLWNGFGGREGCLSIVNPKINFNGKTFDYRMFTYNTSGRGILNALMPTDANTLQPIAAVSAYNRGTVKFNISYFTGEKDVVQMAVYRSGGSISVLSASKTRDTSAGGSGTQYPLYYKISGNAIIVFAQLGTQSSPWGQVITVEALEQSNATVLPANTMYNDKTSPFAVANRTTDMTGATAIS